MKAIPALLGLFFVCELAMAEAVDILTLDDENTTPKGNNPSISEEISSSVETMINEPTPDKPVAEKAMVEKSTPLPQEQKIVPTPEPSESATIYSEPTKPIVQKPVIQKPIVQESFPAPIIQEPMAQEPVAQPPVAAQESPKSISCTQSPAIKKINTQGPSAGCFELLENGTIKIKYNKQTIVIERQGLDVKVTCETPKATDRTLYSFKTDKEKRVLSIQSKKVLNENVPEESLAQLDYDNEGKCFDKTNSDSPTNGDSSRIPSSK